VDKGETFGNRVIDRREASCLLTYKTNVRTNIPRPKIMKINLQTLKETKRNLVVPKFAVDYKLYQQEEYVNNYNK
jgi:hypothetical protein